MGLRVWGTTFADLLIQAARGVAAVLTDLRRVRPRERVPIRVEGVDAEDLLVRWLQEVLYLHDSRGWVFRRFGVSRLRMARGGAVEGWAEGEPVDFARHTIHREIKSVTYHRLVVRQGTRGWETRIILDL